MHILVTGGAGVIGSNLCEKLLSLGYSVECIDNLHTGRLGNIAKCQENENFTFFEHDVIERYEPKRKPDQIYNLASPASVPYCTTSPVQITLTNVVGSYNMLELAKACDATILEASTSEVYGNPEIHPQPESYNGNVTPIGVRSCYDESKRTAESLFFTYWRTYGTKIKVARIFNTYGPPSRHDDGRIVPNFIVQALLGKPLTIYGDGSQTRSLCYVDDMVDGLILLMNSDSDVTGPMNIGSQREHTILELAQLILDLTGSSSELVFLDLPSDDPLVRNPDTTYAKNTLDWSPSVSLEDGLTKTIAFFQELIDGGLIDVSEIASIS